MKFNPSGQAAADAQLCDRSANALVSFVAAPAPKSWTSSVYTDCVFLGTLRNKHGDRLVVLNRVKAYNYTAPADQLVAHVIRPGNLLRAPQLLFEGSEQPTGASVKTGTWKNNTVVLSLGVCDPSDHSRFSISYRIEDQTGTLQGHLDDADHVHLIDKSSSGIWIAHESWQPSPYDSADGPLPFANQ